MNLSERTSAIRQPQIVSAVQTPCVLTKKEISEHFVSVEQLHEDLTGLVRSLLYRE